MSHLPAMSLPRVHRHSNRRLRAVACACLAGTLIADPPATMVSTSFCLRLLAGQVSGDPATKHRGYFLIEVDIPYAFRQAGYSTKAWSDKFPEIGLKKLTIWVVSASKSLIRAGVVMCEVKKKLLNCL
ncbi:hypothetical protein GGX14DRAFT_400863 [Mycena pura]|uniref:Uncharacterized protein n=1 Tax=Mycena pura TaxID=153505 RepID=A0AAD6Y5E5_9AGAR|nr:hypothetical protein GGX14DRAFT_400863 [Mycena pura]